MTDQQPTTPPPGYGYPPQGYAPQPPKKSSAGKIVAIILGSIVGFFVLVGGCAAVLVSGDSGGSTEKPPAAAGSEAQEKAGEPAPAEEAAEEPAVEESPIKVEATKTEFTPGVLYTGGDFTSVQVTITNNSDENVDVNPLYFAITDTNGTKHNADALGEDENQIDTLTLAPGENVTGAITAEGAFEPASVTYEEGWFGSDPVKANVK